MKKLAILALLAATVTSVYAQGAAPRSGQAPGGRPGGQRMAPGQRMAKMNEEIFKQLNLTADQKKKVEALNKTQAAKVKKAFDAAKGDRSKMRDQFRAMNEAYEKGLFAILTDPQEKKYKDLRKAQREKMRAQFGGRPGRRPGGPGKP